MPGCLLEFEGIKKIKKMAACGAGARHITMKAHSVPVQVGTAIYNPSMPQAAGCALVVGTFSCVLSLLNRLLHARSMTAVCQM